jgi:DNA polymerase-2
VVGGVGRIVTYVVTTGRPGAGGTHHAPPDYEHYVPQQLRPIADAVLRFLSAPDFDTLSGARGS